MRIHLIAVGRKPRSWVAEAMQDYGKRIRRDIELIIRDISPAAASAARGSQLAAEAARLRKAIPDRAHVVALDERGTELSSAELAKMLASWLENHRDVALVIGGANGLEAGFVAAAGARWALSRLTLPHQLCRVIVAEQLYRAWSIINDHPYHRV